MATVLSSLALNLGFDLALFEDNVRKVSSVTESWADNTESTLGDVQMALNQTTSMFGEVGETLSQALQPARRLFPTAIISQDDIEQLRRYDGALKSINSTIQETRAQGALLATDIAEGVGLGQLSETALEPTARGFITRGFLGAKQAAEELGGAPALMGPNADTLRFVRGFLGLQSLQAAGEIRQFFGGDAEDRQRRADVQASRRGRFDPVQFRRALLLRQKLAPSALRIIAR